MAMKFFSLILLVSFCAIHSAEAGWGKGSRLGPKIRRPSIPVIVPVILPGGGYRRYNNGLRCYSCQGTDNDQCALNPSSVARRVTCRSDQICSVVRIEMTPTSTSKPKIISNSTVSTTTTTEAPVTTSTSTTEAPIISTSASLDGESGSNSNATLDSILNAILKVEEGDTNSTEIGSSNVTVVVQAPKKNIKQASVIVSRGCRPVNFIESTVGSSDFRIRQYTQFCSTDLCNYGDGRLQCYQCSGKGREHCVTKASSVAKVVTCPPSHYCSIVLTETSNNSTGAVISVERGCRSITSQNETEGDYEDNVKSLIRSCSSDLCNGADGLALYLGSNASTRRPDIILPGIVFALFISSFLWI